MAQITVKTNNTKRDVLQWHDLTDKEKEEFDYIDTEEKQYSAEFFRYRGSCYDISEFQRITAPGACLNGWAYVAHDNEDGTQSPLRKWDAIQTDSYFSGIVFRYVPDTDCEQIVVGRVYS